MPMKIKNVMFLIGALVATDAQAETVQGLDVDVQFYTPSIVRVYKVPQGSSTRLKAFR